VDRLRPVFLTTATTVLGLAPLLTERSAQAQFLKPTVITLVYGLGFGMFLVLLVIPALVAIQHDVARYVAAFKRGIKFRGMAIRVWLALAFAVMLAWLGVTLGYTAWFGQLPEVLAQGPVAQVAPNFAALGLFLVGAGALALVFYILGGFGLGIKRMMRS